MKSILSIFARYLDRLTRAEISALAVFGSLAIGLVDYLTGYEVAMSLFYLGPVAVATWYAGSRFGAAIAFLSCICWYIADFAAGGQYSHPAIPIWNALIRLAFFFITGLLLGALRESLRAQQNLARTDGLTGLYVRREFDSRLKHDLAMTQRRKSALTLAYVDVDDFKAVNDSLGHAGGDRVLKAIGEALNRSMRQVDTAARVGGDEFAVILPDTDSLGAQEVISKLTHELHESVGEQRFGVTCSIGVVTIQDSEVSSEQAVAAADALMYQVKFKGKSAVAFSVYRKEPGIKGT